MRRLFPVTDVTDATGEAAAREWSPAELAAAYAYPEPGPEGREPWLRANMVSTLDGAAQHDGRSQPISCPADMRIFGVLRALADVVLVGAETARQHSSSASSPAALSAAAVSSRLRASSALRTSSA
ncbi:dihydrofolate reductase family protein, partial [Streptomyces fungicidicus]